MTEKKTISLTVNGRSEAVKAYPLARLLDVLRDDLRLTGTKEGCGEGECGACSVLLDGELVNSCLVPVAQAEGAAVRTIEGVGADRALAGIQAAFIAENGAQCGICTPGMIMASVKLLERTQAPSGAEIREALAGNLCRCTGYTRIFTAVEAAAAAMRAAQHPQGRTR
jgi:carbon-monoxide dehydrogenase small subunit